MKITLTGNKTGVYIDRNNRAYIDPTEANNYNTVNMQAVNHLIIDRTASGSMRIIQASGYSADRGLFSDMY